jgi:kynurenine formamidase
VSAHAPKQIGANGVKQIVRLERQIIDDAQCRIASFDFCNGNRAVEGNNRTRPARHELIVQLQNLPPIRLVSSRRIAVYRVDRRLDLVWAGLVAPLAVLSIKARADKNADATVRVDDVIAWEKTHGRIPSGAFVAMDSGWDARVTDARRFLNADAKNTLHFPGFSGEAARLLVQERDIVGVGVDTLSLDAARREILSHTWRFSRADGWSCRQSRRRPPPERRIIGGPKHREASGIGPVSAVA